MFWSRKVVSCEKCIALEQQLADMKSEMGYLDRRIDRMDETCHNIRQWQYIEQRAWQLMSKGD